MPQALTRKNSYFMNLLKRIIKCYELYLLLLPTLTFYIIFAYGPMYGLQIAFREFIGPLGISGSPWVGLRHFRNFFDSFFFWVIIRNTLAISLYSLLAGFPIPIILALMLNEVKNLKYKKFIQTVTYAPFFISTVVMVGIVLLMLSPSTGVINHLRRLIGLEAIHFMALPGLFRHVFVWSGIWQGAGFGTIIYLAALSGVDPEMHEAAVIDGANRLQRIWHINIPCILPTMVILFILNTGSIMNVGFERVFLMQNSLNLGVSEVIATFVYQRGLIRADFSFASAVGLFNNVINFIILLSVNFLAGKVGETKLF